MDWFRWHHGCVRDEKFGLVARKSGASVAEVIAVWAYLLEAASANLGDRGNPGNLDFEAIDFALGLRDGSSHSIHGAMTARGIVNNDGRLSAWEKRQPKREDMGATGRKRQQRDSQKVPHGHAASRTVTHGHDRREEKRVEEIREEENPPTPLAAEPQAPTPEPPPEASYRPAGAGGVHRQDRYA